MLFLRTARSWVAALLPVLVAAAVLLVVILVGVQHPSSLLLQGAGFAAVALAWLALRERRESASVRGGRRTPVRAVAGVGLLAVAASAAIPVANAVMGEDTERVVLRDHVTPPFDIGRYPSPLASFRNYVDLKGRKESLNVHDRSSSRSTGAAGGHPAAPGHPGRLGRAGLRGDQRPPGDRGRRRVPAGLLRHRQPRRRRPGAGAGDRGEGYTGVWLPTVGALQSMRFERGDADGKEESFRYNLATSTAVVPSGMYPGDVYTFRRSSPTTSSPPRRAPPRWSRRRGEHRLPGPGRDKWTEDAPTPMARVFAVAKRLRTEGKYSDGVLKAERIYYAGHGL